MLISQIAAAEAERQARHALYAQIREGVTAGLSYDGIVALKNAETLATLTDDGWDVTTKHYTYNGHLLELGRALQEMGIVPAVVAGYLGGTLQVSISCHGGVWVSLV